MDFLMIKQTLQVGEGFAAIEVEAFVLLTDHRVESYVFEFGLHDLLERFVILLSGGHLSLVELVEYSDLNLRLVEFK
jgi:hypothetical protein